MLQLIAWEWINIYTDFKYAFTTIHTYGALYKERGFINSEGNSVKYEQEIVELLKGIWASK
jgi:hypothetical protein